MRYFRRSRSADFLFQYKRNKIGKQNARSGLAASDTGAVLESGVVRLVATGASLLEDPQVARLYLGAATPAPGKRQ